MRGKKSKIRPDRKDSRYQDVIVSKLINYIMISGKKTIARQQVYSALEAAGKTLKKEPLVVLQSALDNIKPKTEVRSRRIGGAAYQIPVPVSARRRLSLALRWLVEAARRRPNKKYHRFFLKLAAELVDASHGEGGAVKKKDDTHRMAEANKAFSHFRW